MSAGPGQTSDEPPAGTEGSGCTKGQSKEAPQGLDVQEWDDGSTYEGELENGLKHGRGKYTWKSGEVIFFFHHNLPSQPNKKNYKCFYCILSINTFLGCGSV